MEPAERVEHVLGSLQLDHAFVATHPLRDIGVKVILSQSAEEKASLTVAAYKHYFPPHPDAGTTLELTLGEPRNIGEGDRKGASVPGLQLLHASRLPNIGKGGSVKSQAMILHALVHVELAAIDISWDLIVRGWRRCPKPCPSQSSGLGTGTAVDNKNENKKNEKKCVSEGELGDLLVLPPQFYLDWLEVAYEEAKHYLILLSRLNELHDETGRAYQYGDFPAHDGIWNDALRTSTNLMERLVLEHCTHEARGVDVCSLITIPRLRRGGDLISAKLLEDIVLVDEIDHISKGVKYFIALLEACDIHENEDEDKYEDKDEDNDNDKEGTKIPTLSPDEVAKSFLQVLYNVQGYNYSKGPFAVEHRRKAGMPDAFYMLDPQTVTTEGQK